MLSLISVLKRLALNCFSIVSITCRLRVFRLSNLVPIIPVMRNDLLSLFFTMSTVSIKCFKPCKAKNSVCKGMNISLAVVSALSVSRPKEGGQSTIR